MTRGTRSTFGSLWVDSLLPLATGALCALIVTFEGGPCWALLLVPALCWIVWQVARWLGAQLVIRALLVTSLAAAILVCFVLFFGVNITKLRKAVSDAGIGINAVSSDRKAIVVSIQPLSWGPERNSALRAILAAAHTYGKSKKQVTIQWGDAMTTTVKMKDIEEFIAGRITYREILNRIDWSGTPNVLPDDSTSSRTPGLISRI